MPGFGRSKETVWQTLEVRQQDTLARKVLKYGIFKRFLF